MKLGDKFRYIYAKSYGTGEVAGTVSQGWFVEVKLSTVSTTMYVAKTWFETPKVYPGPNTIDLTFIDWETEKPVDDSLEFCFHNLVDYVGFTEKYKYCTKCDKKEFR